MEESDREIAQVSGPNYQHKEEKVDTRVRQEIRDLKRCVRKKQTRKSQKHPS